MSVSLEPWIARTDERCWNFLADGEVLGFASLAPNSDEWKLYYEMEDLERWRQPCQSAFQAKFPEAKHSEWRIVHKPLVPGYPPEMECVPLKVATLT